MYTASSNSFAAAAFAFVVSAALFAYAIIPASPTMMV
ncbi:MAG: enoyl-CoA hydratase [Pseudomonadota bacterium]